MPLIGINHATHHLAPLASLRRHSSMKPPSGMCKLTKRLNHLLSLILPINLYYITEQKPLLHQWMFSELQPKWAQPPTCEICPPFVKAVNHIRNSKVSVLVLLRSSRKRKISNYDTPNKLLDQLIAGNSRSKSASMNPYRQTVHQITKKREWR